MNEKFADYNLIPIGDHCAISMILNDLQLRCKSYPFDWVSNKDELYNTNIVYNIHIIQQLNVENVQNVVIKYIGDAFNNDIKTNTFNSIWFPHDTENINDIFKKYERRFDRLKNDLNKKNMFILLTRHYYIDEQIFQTIMETLLNNNNDSIILFISGTNHPYLEDIKYNKVIFKYIHYDISQFYNYDYSDFRPNIKTFLSELLI